MTTTIRPAQWPSTCATCGGHIAPGDPIHYAPGVSATHAACEPSAETKAARCARQARERLNSNVAANGEAHERREGIRDALVAEYGLVRCQHPVAAVVPMPAGHVLASGIEDGAPTSLLRYDTEVGVIPLETIGGATWTVTTWASPAVVAEAAEIAAQRAAAARRPRGRPRKVRA